VRPFAGRALSNEPAGKGYVCEGGEPVDPLERGPIFLTTARHYRFAQLPWLGLPPTVRGHQEETLSQHLMINPPEMAPAIGYSHAVTAAPGRSVYLAGQIAFDGEGRIIGDTWPEQFDVALGNLVAALTASGGLPEHVVWMQIFTSDVAAYRAARPELGPIYRRHLGRHFPAMGLYGISELADVGALMEVTAIAVIPD